MPKILIVEDEKKIARFLELELRHEGYDVLTAFDGRSGLETALENDPDLLILDLMLPELSDRGTAGKNPCGAEKTPGKGRGAADTGGSCTDRRMRQHRYSFMAGACKRGTGFTDQKGI